jgi:hypothetical protein
MAFDVQLSHGVTHEAVDERDTALPAGDGRLLPGEHPAEELEARIGKGAGEIDRDSRHVAGREPGLPGLERSPGELIREGAKERGLLEHDRGGLVDALRLRPVRPVEARHRFGCGLEGEWLAGGTDAGLCLRLLCCGEPGFEGHDAARAIERIGCARQREDSFEIAKVAFPDGTACGVVLQVVVAVREQRASLAHRHDQP